MPVFRSPALAKVDPAAKKRISTSLSRPLIYPPVLIEELPVMLEVSSAVSRSDREPKEGLNPPFGRFKSIAENAGEASTDSTPLRGG